MPKGKIQYTMKVKKFLIILALILLINISLLSYNTSKWNFKNNHNSFQVQTSYESSLAYGEYVYFYFSADENDRISWEFSGTNNYVGIKVYAMTDTEFSKFQALQTFYAYILSNGSYYRDFGTFFPQSHDTWYIVFLNIDSDMQITYLTYDVDIDHEYNSLFLEIFIPIMVAIIIMGLIAAIAEYSKKQKKKNELEASSQAKIKLISTEVLPNQIENEIKYCTQCGTPNKLNCLYCIKCGNKFD